MTGRELAHDAITPRRKGGAPSFTGAAYRSVGRLLFPLEDRPQGALFGMWYRCTGDALSWRGVADVLAVDDNPSFYNGAARFAAQYPIGEFGSGLQYLPEAA